MLKSFKVTLNERTLFLIIIQSFCLILKESARRIAKISEEAKMDIDVDEYVESFKAQMMDVVYAWSTGSIFADICKMTDVFEGMG